MIPSVDIFSTDNFTGFSVSLILKSATFEHFASSLYELLCFPSNIVIAYVT